MCEKYIIDVDTGVDDAQAIMLALSRPDIEVVAITCVAGNVDVDQVCINTLKVLAVCDRLDVPVYRGSNTPLVGEGIDATFYHGNDGLGDADLDIAVAMDKLQKEHAVSALLRLVNENPGEITLVALAPLTNIALALKQDKDFGKKLKKISIMGGNTYGRGNSTLCGEFNFACDPDAAYVVLSELSAPITLYPWELNPISANGHPWTWLHRWIQTDSLKGKFIKSVTKPVVLFEKMNNKSFYVPCDLNAIATVIDPSIVMATQDVFATIELHGKYTRGMMVVDWSGRLKRSPNLTIINEIDTMRARSMFENMLT